MIRTEKTLSLPSPGVPGEGRRWSLFAILRLLIVALVGIGVLGCGPVNTTLLARSTGGWNWRTVNGHAFETTHYRIHTTVTDPAIVEHFTRTMESANAKYRELVPNLRLTAPAEDQKLKIYFFATYDEWAAYTVATTGADADAYLSVVTGGYAIRDEFVCWLGTETDTLAVASHEGFHQFVGRHFRSRLPPTLEEGLATTFENLSVSDSGVTINTDHNPRRQLALRRAIDENYLLPLETLLQLHAGDLAGRSNEIIETYYAQSWALARMLRDQPAYRAPFLRLIHDTAVGEPRVNSDARAADAQLYFPARVKPLLQKHVAPDWARFSAEYDAFVRRVALQPQDL